MIEVISKIFAKLLSVFFVIHVLLWFWLGVFVADTHQVYLVLGLNGPRIILVVFPLIGFFTGVLIYGLLFTIVAINQKL